jgi:NAD(P)H-hydrate epimerase
MATAGSGDVLTGILLSLLAQGYSPENAAVLGVYLHGLAGDFAAEQLCYESIIATDITKCLAKAFNKIREL